MVQAAQTQPATCIVYLYLQDILGNSIGSTNNATFSVYGGSFKYGDNFVDQSYASSNFDSSGYAQLQIIETQTPGINMNFSVKYQVGNSTKQINFDPVIVPNVGAINLATIATIKGN